MNVESDVRQHVIFLKAKQLKRRGTKVLENLTFKLKGRRFDENN